MQKIKYVLEDGSDMNWPSVQEPIPEDDVPRCLITGDPLENNHIQMECGHRFNYVPLYKDLVNHKKKFNRSETVKLNVNELRCPYCRSKQRKLLPYYALPGVFPTHGINCIDESVLLSFHYGSCDYGNHTAAGCHETTVIKLPLDGKSYCLLHHAAVLKKAAQQAKQKEKEEAKKAKQEAKAKQPVCQAMVKTGPRKGQGCGCRTLVDGTPFCKRHGGSSPAPVSIL